MNFLSRLFSRPPEPQTQIEEKASRAYSAHFFTPSAATWSKRDYASFADEAYQKNVVAYQAVNKIATAVASIEWEVWKGDEQLTSHPLLDLLRRPNPLMSGPEWWRTRISYMLLAGNSYDERVMLGNRIIELWPLRPDRVKVLGGPRGLPVRFEYTVGGQKEVFLADDVTGDSEILHVRLFHPMNDWGGLSPVEAAAYAVDQHNFTMKWIQSLLQNSARPSGSLVVDKEVTLSDQEFARLKSTIEDTYSGSQNAGRPMLLEGGMKWQQMGLSPVDMEILRTKDSSARDISLAFGVPPLLLNIPGDNTYANYREARLGFYEDTVLPLVNYVAEKFNTWVAPFYDGATIRPNKDKIEAIADKRMKLWEMADNSDDLTLNESRELKGYDPLPAPLGNMLMSEVRKMGMKEPKAKPDAETLKRLAYGND